MINCDQRRRKRGRQVVMTAGGRDFRGMGWHGWVALVFRTRAQGEAVPQVQGSTGKHRHRAREMWRVEAESWRA